MVNPFTIILFLLSIVSLITDYIIPLPEDKNGATVIIIVAMVTISGLLKFVQEGKSNNAGKKLSSMIKIIAIVLRNETYTEVEIENIVPGDIIKLAARDMIPTDIRILFAFT